jgi:hypothetical protein
MKIQTIFFYSVCTKFFFCPYVMASRTHTRCRQQLLQTTSSQKLLHVQTFCTYVAWVSAYKLCAQQLHQGLTGHTACQNVPKSIYLKNSLPQNQKWCRKTEYSFGKLKRSFISCTNRIFFQLILLL